MSGDALYYILCPLTIDTGVGYDHIILVIGAAHTTRNDADFICYVTPAEYFALTNKNNIREGVRVTLLALRVGDVALYILTDEKMNKTNYKLKKIFFIFNKKN